MTRRNFLKQSIGGGALLSLATPAVAQAPASLRLLSTDRVSTTILTDKISAVSGGTLNIETQILPEADGPSMLSRVASGEADMCLAPLEQFVSQDLTFGLFSSMPFGMSTGELEGWIHASDGGDMLEMLGEDLGLSFRFAGDSGVKPMWSKRPLSNLDALKASKVGSRGLGVLNLKTIGVSSVVDLADPSVDLQALDVIDQMSVVDLQARGLAETFPHMTKTNPNAPSAVISLAMSNGAAAALSPAHKLLIERACSAALSEARAQSFHENATAILKAGSRFTPNAIPDDIWQALQGGAQNVLQTIFDQGDLQASVVDAYVYFLTDIAGWSEIGEAAFYTGRKRLVSL